MIKDETQRQNIQGKEEGRLGLVLPNISHSPNEKKTGSAVLAGCARTHPRAREKKGDRNGEKEGEIKAAASEK